MYSLGGSHEHFPQCLGVSFLDDFLFFFLFSLCQNSRFGLGAFLLLLIFLNSAKSIDKFHLTGIERMAFEANLRMDRGFGRPYGKHIAAAANYLGLRIPFGMYTGFHKKRLY